LAQLFDYPSAGYEGHLYVWEGEFDDRQLSLHLWKKKVNKRWHVAAQVIENGDTEVTMKPDELLRLLVYAMYMRIAREGIPDPLSKRDRFEIVLENLHD